MHPNRRFHPLDMCACGAGSIVLVAILAPGTAEAATVDYSIEQRGTVIAQTAAVADGKVLVKGAGGDPDKDILFDAGRGILFVIDHRERSFVQIDNGTIDEVGSMMDSVSAVIDAQPGVVADLLGSVGLGGERPRMAAMSDSGREIRIGGYPCRLYEAQAKATLQAQMCVAENTVLKLAASEFNTLRSFLAFGNRLALRAGRLLTALGLNLPELGLVSSSGLPVGVFSAADELKVRVVRINTAAGHDAAIGVPAGYARSAIPFVSHAE